MRLVGGRPYVFRSKSSPLRVEVPSRKDLVRPGIWRPCRLGVERAGQPEVRARSYFHPDWFRLMKFSFSSEYQRQEGSNDCLLRRNILTATRKRLHRSVRRKLRKPRSNTKGGEHAAIGKAWEPRHWRLLEQESIGAARGLMTQPGGGVRSIMNGHGVDNTRQSLDGGQYYEGNQDRIGCSCGPKWGPRYRSQEGFSPQRKGAPVDPGKLCLSRIQNA